MLDIYEKRVEIKTRSGISVTLLIRPLLGDHYALFMSTVAKLSGADGEKAADTMKRLDKVTTKDLHSIIVESVKHNFVGEDPSRVEQFVSQNMFLLLDHVVDVNLAPDAK